MIEFKVGDRVGWALKKDGGMWSPDLGEVAAVKVGQGRVQVQWDDGDLEWVYDEDLRVIDAIELLGEIGAQFIALETDVGRSVVYTAYEGAQAEDGVITGVNDIFVFVRYGSDKSSKATRPQDLKWLSS